MLKEVFTIVVRNSEIVESNGGKTTVLNEMYRRVLARKHRDQ